MAYEAQGITILRGASTYASTSYTANGIDGIKFVAATTSINCTGGDFTAHFSSGMEILTNSSACPGPYIAKAVAATIISVYQPVTHTTQSTAFVITGRVMGAIGEVVSVNALTGAAAVIDVTNLQSTAKEKMMGLRDEGQVTFEMFMNATATAQQGLFDDMKNRKKNRFHIGLTDATGTEQPTKICFSGYVMSAPITAAVDNAVKRNVTIEIASAVDWLART